MQRQTLNANPTNRPLPMLEEKLASLREMKLRNERNIYKAVQRIGTCLCLAIFLVFVSTLIPRSSIWMTIMWKCFGIGISVIFIGLAAVISALNLKCEFLQREINEVKNEISAEQANTSRVRHDIEQSSLALEENRATWNEVKKLRSHFSNLFSVNNMQRWVPAIPRDSRWTNDPLMVNLSGSSWTNNVPGIYTEENGHDSYDSDDKLGPQGPTIMTADEHVTEEQHGEEDAFHSDPISFTEASQDAWTHNEDKNIRENYFNIVFQDMVQKLMTKNVAEDVWGDETLKGVDYSKAFTQKKDIDQQLDEYISFMRSLGLNQSNNKQTNISTYEQKPPVSRWETASDAAQDMGVKPRKRSGEPEPEDYLKPVTGPFEYYIHLNPLPPGSSQHIFDCLNGPANELSYQNSFHTSELLAI